MFRFTQLHLEQYRCFEALDLHLEPDLTVLCAENGGGKTAVLTALAVGLTPFQSGTLRGLKLDPRRDPRPITLDERGRREPAGPCTLIWTADVGAAAGVNWISIVIPPQTARRISTMGTWSTRWSRFVGPARAGPGLPSTAWIGWGVARHRPDRPPVLPTAGRGTQAA